MRFFFPTNFSHRLIFLLLVRGPSTNLHGNTAQPFPGLPGRHPGHRRGPGHPGGWEHGGGRGRADAQPAGGAELRHPERHGVHVSSHQDWQGELPDVVIKAPASSASSSVPSELLPALACEGFLDAFKETSASVSGLLPLLQRGGSSSLEACCALRSFILSVSSRLAHEQTIPQGSLVLFCVSVGGWQPSQHIAEGCTLTPATAAVNSYCLEFLFFCSTVQRSTTRVCLGLSVYFK